MATPIDQSSFYITPFRTKGTPMVLTWSTTLEMISRLNMVKWQSTWLPGLSKWKNHGYKLNINGHCDEGKVGIVWNLTKWWRIYVKTKESDGSWRKPMQQHSSSFRVWMEVAQIGFNLSNLPSHTHTPGVVNNRQDRPTKIPTPLSTHSERK